MVTKYFVMKLHTYLAVLIAYLPNFGYFFSLEDTWHSCS